MRDPSIDEPRTTTWSTPPPLRTFEQPLQVEIEPAPPEPEPEPPEGWPRWRVPTLLFLLTGLSTFFAAGPVYAGGIMLILTFHEMGHYLQARRLGIPASPPYFLPMPLTPIGTMGAVIRMKAFLADRRALYDIAISGPLAGLVPAVLFSAIGIRSSEVVEISSFTGGSLELGEPLVFQALSWLLVGPLPEGQTLMLHPLGYAGWVGILITAINLLPISQLDGGHILYALLPRRANKIAMILAVAVLAAIIIGKYWGWILMWSLIVFLVGVRHPPTADDHIPLGRGRILLGWLTLAFVVLGFTPVPLVFNPGPT